MWSDLERLPRHDAEELGGADDGALEVGFVVA